MCDITLVSAQCKDLYIEFQRLSKFCEYLSVVLQFILMIGAAL